MVLDLPGLAQKDGVEPVFVDVDDHGADFVEGQIMRGVVERAAGGLACAAGDGVNDAKPVSVLAIGAGAIHAAVATVHFHTRSQGAGQTVVTVQEIRAFPGMGMAVEHDIHAVGFEDGQNVCANVDQFLFAIGVVVAFGVWRVMEENDQPFRTGLREVGLQPFGHRTRGSAAAGHRIEGDEMDIGVIE